MDVSWATLLAARTLGFFGEDSAQEALREDPYNPDLLSVYPYVPGYLDLIEEWLRGLRR